MWINGTYIVRVEIIDWVYNESLFSPKFTYIYIYIKLLNNIVVDNLSNDYVIYFWFHGIVLYRRLSYFECYSRLFPAFLGGSDLAMVKWLQPVLGHCSFMPCRLKLMPWKRICSDVNRNLWNIWSGIILVLSHLL